ncbi:hypothetical protein CDIF100009_03961 (plasmid) [Clostridioides difficile]
MDGLRVFKVGDIFTVINIFNDGAIHFKTDYGIGFMNYSKFEAYFEIVQQKKKYEWGAWSIRGDFSGAYLYRTNGKKVEVRKGNFKASSTCHDTDVFNLQKGIKICLARIEVKEAEHRLNLLLDEINNK